MSIEIERDILDNVNSMVGRPSRAAPDPVEGAFGRTYSMAQDARELRREDPGFMDVMRAVKENGTITSSINRLIERRVMRKVDGPTGVGGFNLRTHWRENPSEREDLVNSGVGLTTLDNMADSVVNESEYTQAAIQSIAMANAGKVLADRPVLGTVASFVAMAGESAVVLPAGGFSSAARIGSFVNGLARQNGVARAISQANRAYALRALAPIRGMSGRAKFGAVSAVVVAEEIALSALLAQGNLENPNYLENIVLGLTANTALSAAMNAPRISRQIRSRRADDRGPDAPASDEPQTQGSQRFETDEVVQRSPTKPEHLEPVMSQQEIVDGFELGSANETILNGTVNNRSVLHRTEGIIDDTRAAISELRSEHAQARSRLDQARVESKRLLDENPRAQSLSEKFKGRKTAKVAKGARGRLRKISPALAGSRTPQDASATLDSLGIQADRAEVESLVSQRNDAEELLEIRREARARVDEARAEVDAIEADIQSKQRIVDEHSKIRDDLATKDPEDEIDVRLARYATMRNVMDGWKKAQRGDNQSLPLWLRPESARQVREEALSRGDQEIVDYIDNLKTRTLADGEIRYSELTTEMIDELAAQERRSTASSFHATNIIDSLQEVFSKSTSPRMRSFGAWILGRRGLERDGVDDLTPNTLGASEYKNQFENAWKDRLDQPMVDGYSAYKKEVYNNEVKLIEGWTHQQQAEYREFNTLVGDYMHSLNGGENITGYPQSVVDAGNKLHSELSIMRDDARKAGWNEGEYGAFVDSQGNRLSGLSRVSDHEVYRTLDKSFDSTGMQQIYSNTEGALISANNMWAIDSALSNPRLPAEMRTSLEEMKARYSGHASRNESGKLSHRHVGEMISELDGLGVRRLTRVIAESMIQNNIRRSKVGAANRVVDESVSMSDLLNEVEAHYADFNGIGQADIQMIRDAVRTAESRRGDADLSVSQFSGRLDMDPTYTTRISSRDGRSHEFNYKSLLSKNTDSIVFNQRIRASKAYGLAKVGVRSRADFSRITQDLREDVGSIGSPSERNKAQRAIDVVERDFLGNPQYDDSGPLMRVARIIRNFSMLRLGKLIVNMQPESANVSASRLIGSQNPAATSLKSLARLAVKAKDDPALIRQMRAMGMINSGSYQRIIMAADSGVDLGGPTVASSRPPWYSDDRSRLDKVLDGGERASGFAKLIGLKTFRGAERRLREQGGISIQQSLHDAVDIGGLSGLTPAKRRRALDFGYTDGFFDRLRKIRDEVFTYDDSGTLVDINQARFKELDQDLYDDYTALMTRSVESAFIAQRIEQLPPFTNTQMFGVFGQFRSFGLASYAVQTKYNAAVRDMDSAQMLIYGVAIGQVTYAVNEISEGRGDDLTEEKVFLAGFRRAGPTALPTSIVDSMLAIVGVDSPFGHASVAIQGNVLDLNGNTISGGINDFVTIAQGMGSLIGGDEDAMGRVVRAMSGLAYPNLPGTGVVHQLLDGE